VGALFLQGLRCDARLDVFLLSLLPEQGSPLWRSCAVRFALDGIFFVRRMNWSGRSDTSCWCITGVRWRGLDTGAGGFICRWFSGDCSLHANFLWMAMRWWCGRIWLGTGGLLRRSRCWHVCAEVFMCSTLAW